MTQPGINQPADADLDGADIGWRQGSAAVAALTFAVDGETPVLSAGRRYGQHAMAMTHQAYGPRVGLPRLLHILDDYDVKATFFVPGWTAQRWPATVAAIAEQGHEIAHHSYSHRPPTGLSAADEREEFERGLAALDSFGIRPTGYRAPMWAATWRTAELVAEYGMSYDTSLMDDDNPYVIDTDRGPVVELPPHWSLDDWEQYAYLPEPSIGTVVEPPEKALAVWTAELDGMRRYGGLFQLTSHAFLSGRPGRAEGLRTLIERILERGDVSFRTCAQVAAAASADSSLQRRKLDPPEVDVDTYPQW